VANTRTTTSRKPRTAARAASRPPTARKDTDAAEPDTSPAQAQEVEADGQYVTALLCGEELQIIPPGQWRQSWQRLLTQGQVDAFAEQVVHPDDLEAFFDIDPTNNELGEFIADAAQQAGESLGKSPGPATSSRRTRKR
jgi:hypothetical protein